MPNTVLIYSGGLDSTVLLYELRTMGNVQPLTFYYGQRHLKEIDHAKKLAPNTIIVDLYKLKDLLPGSSQTDESVLVPEGHYADETMKLTIVPNRNMIMLSVAVGWAYAHNFDEVAYAAHGGDHAIYPDCRPEFVDAMNLVTRLATGRKIKILAPYLSYSKHNIVQFGHKLHVPFAQTWSCYNGRQLHCGKCGTCVERIEAFDRAGVPDPTPYETNIRGPE